MKTALKCVVLASEGIGPRSGARVALFWCKDCVDRQAREEGPPQSPQGQSLVAFLRNDILSSLLFEKVLSESLERSCRLGSLLSLYRLIVSITQYRASKCSWSKICLSVTGEA
jgi:hypothetical protein